MNGLINAFYTSCVRLTRKETPDGMGGSSVKWIDGKTFAAALTEKSSARRTSAEKDGVGEAYRVTTAVGTHLMFGDVFRRKTDGAVFRVTSNYTDTSPPKCAGFMFEQVTAERWDLT